MEESTKKPLTDGDIRDAYRVLANAHSEKQEFEKAAKANPEKYNEIISHASSWSAYYDLPWPILIVFFLDILGIRDALLKAATSKDPTNSLIKYMESKPRLPLESEDLAVEEQAEVFTLLQAMMSNLESCKQYGIPLNDLIAKSVEDESLLFRAIKLDHTVITCPSVATRIVQAQLKDDKKFAQQLAKAIQGTKPIRPKESLDDARFLIAVLSESGTLDQRPSEEIYNVLVNDLQVYPDNGEDPFGGLIKLIRKTQKMSRN